MSSNDLRTQLRELIQEGYGEAQFHSNPDSWIDTLFQHVRPIVDMAKSDALHEAADDFMPGPSANAFIKSLHDRADMITRGEIR